MKNHVLVVMGGLVGAVVGYLAFMWMVGHGFYALVLPGGLAGLGAGIFRSRSVVVSVICGVVALAAGLVAEWRWAPFKVDESLGYFLMHAGALRAVTMLMIAAGVAIGFWVPFSRGRA